MNKFNVGDLVVREDGAYLRSGSEAYGLGIVIQSDPLVLASQDGDMRWESTIRNVAFRKVGFVSWWKRRAAMSRLKN